MTLIFVYVIEEGAPTANALPRATPCRYSERPKWSYRVTRMAETDTETTALAPRELVTEIERTRANLAQTIDEIADRVAPGNIARRAGAPAPTSRRPSTRSPTGSPPATSRGARATAPRSGSARSTR